MKKTILTAFVFGTMLLSGCSQQINNTSNKEINNNKLSNTTIQLTAESKNTENDSGDIKNLSLQDEKFDNYYGFAFNLQYPSNYSESKLFDWIQIESNDGLTNFSIHRSSKEKQWLELGEKMDFTNPLNSELLSLSEYIEKYYRLYDYENPLSGAYGNSDYKNVLQSGLFEKIRSKDTSNEILRGKLNQNLNGFESTAYLMNDRNKEIIMIFYWNTSSTDKKIAENELQIFDNILSSLVFKEKK